MSDIKQALDEFRIKRTALEDRLRDLINAESTAFFNETGVQVAGMKVAMVRIDLMGMPPEFLIAAVSVDTPLDG